MPTPRMLLAANVQIPHNLYIHDCQLHISTAQRIVTYIQACPLDLDRLGGLPNHEGLLNALGHGSDSIFLVLKHHKAVAVQGSKRIQDVREQPRARGVWLQVWGSSRDTVPEGKGRI